MVRNFLWIKITGNFYDSKKYTAAYVQRKYSWHLKTEKQWLIWVVKFSSNKKDWWILNCLVNTWTDLNSTFFLLNFYSFLELSNKINSLRNKLNNQSFCQPNDQQISNFKINFMFRFECTTLTYFLNGLYYQRSTKDGWLPKRIGN